MLKLRDKNKRNKKRKVILAKEKSSRFVNIFNYWRWKFGLFDVY